MELEYIGDNMRNWVDLAQVRDYLRGLCECGVEYPDSISHGVG